MCSVPSGPAQDLNITVLSSEEALVMWEALNLEDQNGIITGYSIDVVVVNTGQSFQVTSTTNILYLDNLLPFTTYTCRVAAMTSIGIGPYTVTAGFMTEEAGAYIKMLAIRFFYLLSIFLSPTAPSSSPENINVSVISSTSVGLSWSPPPLPDRNGIITEYKINVTELDTGRVQVLISFTTTFTVQRLHPYYTYEFALSAHTVATGPYSDSEIIQTPEDGKETYCTCCACEIMITDQNTQLSIMHVLHSRSHT